jgi:hypothetical protein
MSGLLVSMIRRFKRRTPHDVEWTVKAIWIVSLA